MLDAGVTKQIAKEIAVRHKVIPVSFENGEVHLAMADVYNVLAIDQVRRNFPKGTKVVPVFCTESEILELNIPTGIPLLFELHEDLRVKSFRYLGDAEAAKKAAEAVANQGKTR